MNLFELFVKIGVKDEASGNISKITSGLGKGLATAAKIGTAAVGAAAAGITALTKAAVDNYAEYEQLVGGVETLFKDSSNTVMQYAKNAYKTAGMSANDYMSTATSFAASLINSFKDTSSEVTEEMAEEMIASLDKQVDAFEEATEAQIKLINKQYTENMKLIDEEEYARLKAVDDQIAAIEAEEKAEEEAIKKRQQEEEKARLQKLIDAAADTQSRRKAEKNLADYMQELAEQERKQARKDQISALKDQKDAIKEEADLKRDALKDQHDYELEAYKDARDKELAYLKEHLKKQEKEIKASIGTMAEEVSLPAEAYEEAAKATDMAISDMSDNANKMGTDMELIKNAYQGFSKQNYTMLDNLKLGYGGTKTEMERLIKDAAKLDDSVDANSMSFGNIVKAIHAVQVEMGIYGTTAKEAGTTIGGSINSMKAAWSNLVTGFADGSADIGGLIDNLVTTIVGDGTENNLGVIGNVLPAVETALVGIGTMIEKAIPVLVEKLPGLLEQILPVLISSAASLVNSVVKILPELVDLIVDALIDNAPMLIVAAVELILALAGGLIQAVPKLLKAIPTIIKETVDGFKNSENIKKFIDVGKNIIEGIKSGIKNAWNNLVKWFKGLFGDLIGIAKKILGIASPSKVFKKLGSFTADGFGIGFEDEFAHVKDDMEDALNFDDASVGINASIRKVGAGAACDAFGGTSFGDIIINIDGAKYSDEQSLASAIALEIQNMTDRRAAVYA